MEKMNKKIVFFFLLLVLTASSYLYSRQEKINFEHISLEQGLSQSTILCIYQDSKGFLWFGTDGGLNRYDGYEFDTFLPEPGNPDSISNGTVWAIIEDQSGMLWLGTYGGGLNKFDREKEIFTHYQTIQGDPTSLSSNDVRAIYEDKEGVLWIGTSEGLNKFDRKTGTFTRYLADDTTANSLSNNHVRSICEDREGFLWIGTNGGLNRFDRARTVFAHYKNNPGNPNSISHDVVRSVLEDRTGMLWIGTTGGLNKFDREAGTFTRYQSEPYNSHSLSNNSVLSLYEDKEGFLWVGTTSGLNKFNPGEGKFIRCLAKAGVEGALSDNSIQAIYEDSSEVLWVGTTLGGLNKYNKAKQRFNHYKSIPNTLNSLSNNNILSIYEDRQGIIWIGTDDGLNRLNRETNIINHYRNNPRDPHSLSHNQVWSIYEDRSGVLWIGTLNCLDRFDRTKGTFKHYPGVQGNPINIIISIHEDREGFLLVGSYDGLLRLNRERTSMTLYKNDTADPDSISHNFVVDICEDNSGTLWIGTIKGLNKFNPGKGTFTRYVAEPGSHSTLSNDKINFIHADQKRDGILWIGTYGGLHKYDSRSSTFTLYTTKDGLPNNVIYGILEDDCGNLWISTNYGLAKFNPQTSVFRNYDADDGLQSNEFKHGSCYRSRNGEMFFGGNNGFNAFFAEQIKDNPYKPAILITGLKIFNKSIRIGERIDGLTILEKNISATGEIKLSYIHSSFSLEYTALHYASPKKNQYAYMMEGLDKDWNYVGNRRFATYAHLSSGKYTFKVKGSNNDGIWNETGTSVKIIIPPPPWRTWWAYSLYVLVLGAGIIAYVRSQKKKLAYERSVNERLRQVDRLKDEFLANTSHELRTPLNAITGIAESLVKGIAGPLSEKTKANLGMVIYSGKRLSNLVNDILDYSKLKERDLTLNLMPVDMKSLVEVVLQFSKSLTVGKPIQLNNEIGDDIPLVKGDENRLQQIMYNLIGNAIKFTESGTVSVSAAENGGMVTIKVLDTGIGIPEGKLEDIFKSFEQVDSSATREHGGTGLGLSITKQLVELHGGTIGVESQVGKGSTFRFSIPICREKVKAAASSVPGTADLSLEPVSEIRPDGAVVRTAGKSKPVAPAATRRGGYRILAVDDELVNLQVLINHLSLHDYEVIKALNGQEALDIILGSEEKPDMVLLDVMMPRMSGFEVCREIRRRYTASELPVIMLTAKNRIANLVEGLNSGANDYLAKPFSSEELLERINVHLQLLKANRDLKQANEKLEDYNQTLEQKVAERTHDLKEKNKLIIDSMIFASHMQQDILPLEEKITAALPQHFILFKPKDIVSGDFYWFEQVGDYIFLAAVDCTGHGVPGALMSMIGYTLLNKLVMEQRVHDPALILEYLHKDVRAASKQRGERHIESAGMDVSLCRIENKKITFSGAHMSLFIAKAGKAGKRQAIPVVEVKGDRKSIAGLYKDTGRSFTNKEIHLQSGDMIYLATDGFAHQNNSKDEKYGKKRLMQFLQSIASLSVAAQRKKFHKELENHMDKEEQRDDITIVGVRMV